MPRTEASSADTANFVVRKRKIEGAQKGKVEMSIRKKNRVSYLSTKESDDDESDHESDVWLSISPSPTPRSDLGYESERDISKSSRPGPINHSQGRNEVENNSSNMIVLDPDSDSDSDVGADHVKLGEKSSQHDSKSVRKQNKIEDLNGKMLDYECKVSNLNHPKRFFAERGKKVVEENERLKRDLVTRTQEHEDTKRKLEEITEKLKEEKEISSAQEEECTRIKADFDKFIDVYNSKYIWLLVELRKRQEQLGERKYTTKQVTDLSEAASKERKAAGKDQNR